MNQKITVLVLALTMAISAVLAVAPIVSENGFAFNDQSHNGRGNAGIIGHDNNAKGFNDQSDNIALGFNDQSDNIHLPH